MLVYPGGDHETFRPCWESDQIEFGGRKGFIKLALEQDVPIVPVVAIGGQETALFLTAAGRSIAKRSGSTEPHPHQGAADRARAAVRRHVLDLPTRIPLPAKITVEVRRRST